MRRIFKYQLDRIDEQEIEGPNLVPLSAGMDPMADLCIWGTVDESAPDLRWLVYVIGTGNPADHTVGASFLGSVKDGPFMWHVFARRRP